MKIIKKTTSSLHRFSLQIFRYLAPLLLLSLLSGCATPIGVTRVSAEKSYRLSTVNPLNQGVLSNSAKAVLQRYNLGETFRNDPQSAIRFLHDTAIHDDRRDILFALAELSYLGGERLLASASPEAPDAFLQSAVYAYLYLLGDGTQPPPSAYDIRFREACDLYNRALGRAFPAKEDGTLEFRSGPRKLTVGDLNITLKPETIAWKLENIEGFLPADAYDIRGFTVRNRTPGLGLPLIALTSKSPDMPRGGVLPVTAFLRVPPKVKELGSDSESATLELYSAYDDTEVKVNGRSVPLETDSTTPLAYRLDNPEIWNLGLKRFLTAGEISNPVILIQPYEPGRIPVVLVHGTASSPVWWAEMINTLRADPVIRKRYQFWFFQYNSSNLITVSAAQLRETLSGMVAKLDPTGKDTALRQMVVIGHSQGGLLTKMTAVEPGDSLWKGISDKSIEELDTDQEVKNIVRSMFFFEPLPFVTRVVFISTPHRGSFRTKNWVRNLVRRFVTLPVDLVFNKGNLYNKFSSQLKLPTSMRNKVPTSIDGMSAENPVLQSLVELPLRPGVTGHSIIAVLPDMEIATGNDGMVEYKSAHIDGVASEFIVRSGHSCQGHPFTIEEVRRILIEHLGVQVAGPAQAKPAQEPLISAAPTTVAEQAPSTSIC
jgi:pimeloyl-ACP methyl ester carboxylesterase